ncbi:alpha-L-fucosidase-like [Watersipora subatra]|uniref:alpha-L-fucosidase-like n=1 Tax=Watersipora subatra TaxID=2589382 RepID=UPI00355C339C
MKNFCTTINLCFLLTVNLFVHTYATYQPTWESLDARPLPAWYDEAKIGIFIHWGVFSVPSFGSEWFWESWQVSEANSSYRQFMKKNYKPGFQYADFASEFTAELYDPDHWADLFNKSGAKYVVLTSKHHEGFCNWATNVSFSWNSVAVGPHRDLVGDLATSIRNRTNITFGLYHSLYEWYNQLYLEDKANKFQTRYFSQGKTIPELYELVNTYKPEVIWSDGEWEASDDYWGSKEFLTWLYNESPVKDTVVVNDRWGMGDSCHHGGYYTCQDRYNPGVLQPHKWENAMTIDKGSWGYRRNVDITSYLTMPELLKTMAQTISCGGNILINVGPTHDGRIIPIFEERLLQLGAWLNVNGEAVYSSKPWIYQNDTITPDIWYTQKKSLSSLSGFSVYAFIFNWPKNNTLMLGAPVATSNTRVSMLGYTEHQLSATPGEQSLEVTLPSFQPNNLPCENAWVLKFDNLNNS